MRAHPYFSDFIMTFFKKKKFLSKAVRELSGNKPRQKSTCIFEKSRFSLQRGGKHRGRGDGRAERGTCYRLPVCGGKTNIGQAWSIKRFPASSSTDELHVAGK